MICILGLYHQMAPARYAMRPPTSRGAGSHWAWSSHRQQGASNANTVRLRGRHLLDHEALTCLLILLFVDEPKLNTTRLHRVLRNLCYHAPTRVWVIRALLSILVKTRDGEDVTLPAAASDKGKSSDKLKKKSVTGSGAPPAVTESASRVACVTSRVSGQPTWLSMSLDAALGCRANVFQIQRGSAPSSPAVIATPVGSGGGRKASSVSIHPQASPVVCRHVLDTLITLAKSFPSQFLPQAQPRARESQCEADRTTPDPANRTTKVATPTPSPSPATAAAETDFWELLVRLDGLSGGRKGKAFQRSHPPTHQSTGEDTVINFDTAPLGQLMTMLSHPVVRRSQQLTDRLLRLLGQVSASLPDITRTTSSTPAVNTDRNQPATTQPGTRPL